MLSINNPIHRGQLEMIALDQLVPENHLVRKMEEAGHLHHHEEVKPSYAKRKEKIERVFADAKEKHGMCWTRLRGLEELSMQAMLTFAAMNSRKWLIGHGMVPKCSE